MVALGCTQLHPEGAMATALGRRRFVTLLGGAAAAPVLAPRVARAQQPVIGFLHPGTADGSANVVAGFRKGLAEACFVEGRNVGIEFRWAQNDNGRLPELAADLVRRRVAVIATLGSAPAGLVVKAATTTIPIVFSIGGDPVALGLVASLNRPGGNVTGITSLNVDLAAKRIGYLHAVAPAGGRIGILGNPDNPTLKPTIADAEAAAKVVGREIEVLGARNFAEIDLALAKLLQGPKPALMVTPGWPFAERRVPIATWAARHAVPAIFSTREWAAAGGLMSYGPDLPDEFRNAGLYAGRILKGEKPADLPVYRAVRFELVINLPTAKIIGVEVPATLLAQADAVIE
jgi:putative tryptophan/tyrosine transport system substrate-binding protein